MAKIKRNIRATAEITLSSMSDIAFLLIIFFLVTSIFLMKDGLHVSMPDRNKPPVFISADKILTVEFRKDGFLYLKDTPRYLYKCGQKSLCEQVLYKVGNFSVS